MRSCSTPLYPFHCQRDERRHSSFEMEQLQAALSVVCRKKRARCSLCGGAALSEILASRTILRPGFSLGFERS